MRAPALKTVRCEVPGCRLKSFKQKYDALHHTHAPSTSLATAAFFKNGSADTLVEQLDPPTEGDSAWLELTPL